MSSPICLRYLLFIYSGAYASCATPQAQRSPRTRSAPSSQTATAGALSRREAAPRHRRALHHWCVSQGRESWALPAHGRTSSSSLLPAEQIWPGGEANPTLPYPFRLPDKFTSPELTGQIQQMGTAFQNILTAEVFSFVVSSLSHSLSNLQQIHQGFHPPQKYEQQL